MATLFVRRAFNHQLRPTTVRSFLSPTTLLKHTFRCSSNIRQISSPSTPLPHLLRFNATRISEAIRNTYRDRPVPARRTSGSSGPNGFFSNFRQRVDRIPSNYIFYGIIVINGLVFVGWWSARQNYHQFRDAGPIVWMLQNFTVSLKNITEGRLWTLLTACFSHEDTGHILLNGMSFFFMAPPVLALLGNMRFLALYLGGGLVSSTVSLVWNALQGRPSQSHGASGAIYSVITFYACVFPRNTFLLFFIVPVPAWLCVSGLFAWDLWSSFKQKGKQGGTDSPGHIGGIVGGILFYLRLASRLRGL